MEWISIKDELPLAGLKVLCFRPFAKELSDDTFAILEYRGYVDVDHRGNTHGFERSHFVSHWKYLEAPEDAI